MKLIDLEIYNFGPFDHVVLDFERIGAAEVIGLEGLNGTGKTMILTAPTAAWTRKWFGRGEPAGEKSDLRGACWKPLETMARGRALLIARWDFAGKVVEIEHRVNGDTGTQEAYLRIDGATANDRGKLREFDAEVVKVFPSQAVYLASALNNRRTRRSLAAVPQAQRKAIFAAMLGLERLEILSAAAGGKAAKEREEAGKVSALLDAAKERAADLGAAQRDLANAVGALNTAREVLEAAEADAKADAAKLDGWKTEAQRLGATAAEAKHARDRAYEAVEAAKVQVKKSRKLLEEATARVVVDESIIATKPGLVASVAAGRVAEAEKARLEAEVLAEDTAKRAAEKAYGEWNARRLKAAAVLTVAKSELAHATVGRMQRIDEIRRDLERAQKSAAKLDTVPCRAQVVVFPAPMPGSLRSDPEPHEADCSTCPLIADATAAQASIPELADRLRAAEATTCDREAEAVRVAEGAIAALGTAPVVPKVEPEAQKRRKGLLTKAEDAIAAGRTAAGRLGAMADVAHRLTGEREDMEMYKVEVGQAEAVEAEAKRVAEVKANAHAHAWAALDEHEACKPAVVGPEAVEDARAEVGEREHDIGACEAVVASAEKAVAEVAQLAADHARQLAEADQWGYLQRALGKNGLQAFEIDAAGPGVSALANGLLAACYGSRFKLDLRTTAPKADGKGVKEVFDVAVMDLERGREGTIDDLSDGEMVLLDEALGLATAVYNADRGGIPALDLYRDECSGSLDTEKAPLYIAMLRQAVRLGRFGRVWFVAHQPELWELADVRLRCANHGVEVVS